MPHAFSPRCRGLLLLVLVTSVGCGPTTVSQKLIGTWEGRPDTFAAQRARDPIPAAPGYHQPKPPTQPISQSDLAEKVERLQPSEETDLEQFEFTVQVEFKPDGHFEMLLNGGSPKTGAWQVLSTDVGITRIELSDGVPPEEPEGEEQHNAEYESFTKRRYSLKLDEDSQGFTLREEGVDPRFGWLYFKRVTSSKQ